MTYGERRKRADSKQVLRDMDLLESAFLSKTQKLNEKRQELLNKKMERLLPEIEKAYENGDSEEVEGLIKSIQIPSGKEWRKNIVSLVTSSAKGGVLRAHLETLDLRKRYLFSEDDWEVSVEGGENFEVIFPPEAQEWIKKYGYQIGVITEDTVRDKIRKEIEKGLVEGTRGRDLIENVRNITGTWISQAHAETIARTETAKMYNAGRIARWLDPELDGFIQALQYDAIVDTRTTDLCRSLDGKIIAVSNAEGVAKYTPPNHYKCRATWIPVTEYEEWTDDFPTDLAPQKGFQFEAELPHLLKGKKEPLVKTVAKVAPSLITDPVAIRLLPDEDFKEAIGNIEDQELKLSMIQERAQLMLSQDKVIVVEKGSMSLEGVGYIDGLYKWSVNGVEWESPLSRPGKDTVEELFSKLAGATPEKARKLIDEFVKEHGSNGRYMAFIASLKDSAKLSSKVTFNGLQKVTDRTQEAKKLFKIKTPPKTYNYKQATALQQAVVDGNAWIDKYLDNKLAPKVGLKLKFKHDNLRAYAQGATGEIFFGRFAKDPAVVVHETAHVIHWNNKEVATLINTFFMKRTANKTIGKKVWGTGKSKEWAYPDDFIHYYTGREYGWEGSKNYKSNGNTASEFYGQEVFSMGLQHMYDDPKAFYEKDKDHFLFTYAIMRGLF